MRVDLPAPVALDRKKWGGGKRRPSLRDFDRTISGDAECYADGKLVAVTRKLGWSDDMKQLLNELRRVQYGRAMRTAGMYTQSKTFGFIPRRALFRDCCTACAFAREHPEAHVHLEKLGLMASKSLLQAHPEQHQHQTAELAAKVGKEWRFDTPSLFTSGVINANHAIPYHVDGGNFKGSWNALIAVQRDMQGGELVAPELRVAFDFREPMLLMMDAQASLHGVRQLRPKNSRAFRYSVVWYALSQLSKCMSPEEELARVRRLKTERSKRRTAPKAEQVARIKGKT